MTDLNFRFIKRCLFLFPFCFSVMISFSQSIKGKVLDANTGEPLVGANVSLENSKFAAIVNLDGSYTLKNIPAGKYEISVTFTGYEKEIKSIEVKAGQETKGINFQIHTVSQEMGSITVSSSRN